MKNAILMSALVSLPVFGGQTAPMAQAPVPAPVVPSAASPWGVEVGASFNWAVPDIYRDWEACKEVKSIGGDVTAVYRLDRHSAITLRIGYSRGGEKWANDVDISEPTVGLQSNMRIITHDHVPVIVDKLKQMIENIRKKRRDRRAEQQSNAVLMSVDSVGEWDGRAGIWTKARVHTFNFMPGYRYTHALTPQLSLYGGVNLGIANASNKLSMYCDNERLFSAHDAAWGFAYSAELGLSYALTPSVDVFASYQFSGNSAKCRLHSEYGDATANRLHYHGVRAGVGFRF